MDVGKDDLDDGAGLSHARDEAQVTIEHVQETDVSLEPRKIYTVVTQMVNVPVVMQRAQQHRIAAFGSTTTSHNNRQIRQCKKEKEGKERRVRKVRKEKRVVR